MHSIAMMIFSSVYIIIDGFFVSNYVGATAFAAVNLIMPVLMILSSMDFNMFASSFFTALNNGPVSALISFARTLVFEVLSILILPGFLGVDGIRGSVIVAEAAALVLSIVCLVLFRKKYRY